MTKQTRQERKQQHVRLYRIGARHGYLHVSSANRSRSGLKQDGNRKRIAFGKYESYRLMTMNASSGALNDRSILRNGRIVVATFCFRCPLSILRHVLPLHLARPRRRVPLAPFSLIARRSNMTAVPSRPPSSAPRRLPIPPPSPARTAPRTPRRLAPALPPIVSTQAHLPPPSFPPIFPSPSSAAPTATLDPLACTPSKSDNDSWLQRSFGIDLSLLSLHHTDDEDERGEDQNENQNENQQEQQHWIEPYPNHEVCTPPRPRHNPSYREFTSPPRPLPPALTPRRVHCASRSRVSQRELRALTSPADALAWDGIDDEKARATGSRVFLTPVRASNAQRIHLGAELIVTPVRRSMRIARPADDMAPIDQPQRANRVLESCDFSFMPNRSLR